MFLQGFFVGKKIKCDGLSVRSVICIVSCVLNYLTVLLYIKTIIHLSVDGGRTSFLRSIISLVIIHPSVGG